MSHYVRCHVCGRSFRDPIVSWEDDKLIETKLACPGCQAKGTLRTTSKEVYRRTEHI